MHNLPTAEIDIEISHFSSNEAFHSFHVTIILISTFTKLFFKSDD